MINTLELDSVIKRTISAVDSSKKQIFDIAEQARQECDHLQNELNQLKKDVIAMIEHEEKLQTKLHYARQKLAEVSRRFDVANELSIKDAYEKAHQLQSELTLTREKEKYLRQRRDELELRLRHLQGTVLKAENLMTQMNVITDYLAGDLSRVSQVVEEARHHQQLGLEVIRAQEEERRRVAREIHDGPAQQMANLALRTELVEKVYIQDGQEKAIQELKELKQHVRSSLNEVRRIIFNLRPMTLDDLGLLPTLGKYIDEMNQQTGLNIELKRFGKHEQRIPSSFEVALFRLVQESIANTVKHAEAKNVQVKIEFQKTMIYLIVEDDGKGFDPESIQRNGFGLLGMKERVRLLGGQMIVQSAVGDGTKLIFHIPNPIHPSPEIDADKSI